jgi:hypothetical protein
MRPVNRITPPPSTGRKYGVILMVLLALVACTSSPPASVSPTPQPPPVSPSPSASATADAGRYTIVAAGDIASCASNGDEATADLVEELLPPTAGSVLALGDLAYDEGTAAQFAECYDPSWGRFLDRTLPTPGNHEYRTRGAAGYFDYFADLSIGAPDGWYEARLFNGWWVISLNSNCDEIRGCETGSEQEGWLRALLGRIGPSAGGDACILAFWHHPRWSSGDEHGSDDRTDGLWRALADAGADIVLTGHDHTYERFVPMDVAGRPDPDGLSQFIVGTGGRSLYGFADILPTSAAHDSSTYGVLQLTLDDGGYEWAFVPVDGGTFTDAGSARCH